MNICGWVAHSLLVAFMLYHGIRYDMYSMCVSLDWFMIFIIPMLAPSCDENLSLVTSVQCRKRKLNTDAGGSVHFYCTAVFVGKSSPVSRVVSGDNTSTDMDIVSEKYPPLRSLCELPFRAPLCITRFKCSFFPAIGCNLHGHLGTSAIGE